jgi:hypothetical protein
MLVVVSDYHISCQMTPQKFNKHLSKALNPKPFPTTSFRLQYNKLLCSVIGGAGGGFHGNVPY